MPLPKGSTSRPAETQRNRPRREYPYVEGQVIGQFVKVSEAQGKTFDDRHLPWEQARKEALLRFTFLVLRPDGDEAQGHGRPVSTALRKPTFIGRPAPGGNASNVYKLLRRMINGSDKDLTDEQLEGLEATIAQMEEEGTQFYLFLEGNEESGWVEVEKVIKPVPAKDRLPKYVPTERPADPRTANDDPSIVCSVTGQAIQGWEKSDGTWVDNREWAKMQAERLGTAAVYTFDDQPGLFAPPFIGKYYKLAKEQKAAEQAGKPF